MHAKSKTEHSDAHVSQTSVVRAIFCEALQSLLQNARAAAHTYCDKIKWWAHFFAPEWGHLVALGDAQYVALIP